ncbi:chromosomal replication initiator protein DnaA [Asticcacaulis excentricus]|uniref:Chromosomal replication initiator protein DnaA n=1 Tax=Asticcacaulis excentricus (strain ATCC 15261 / DSM 4724 / KCTC 12464 / NCIMB 9791 / VKM B-1370 / CB 48) TaxID=573065 RepID=E8RMU2_ASTEC|nr:chromosomal replication initiator protein DnaA [Asticcacaulis excentricus]ADU11705.1 chromosomal replication initiator protein DnaA [Asticcacaulis excentricus CB 48]
MPGVNNWSPIQPEMVWTKVASALRHELGEGPYNSYVAPSALRQNPLGDPVLVTPTLYARDWFARNALRRANELWAQHDPDHRSLELKSRAEFDDQSKSAPMTPVTRTDSAENAPAAPVVSFQDAVARVAGLQERLTFETFVPGRGNEFAYTMSRQVATWADGHFNPVFFHGPYGYGKTHLLNAIAWEAKARRQDAKVVYLTAEKFTSTFVKSLQDRSTAAFKDELRSADLLLIDDVHFIGGKTSSQEELFHTLTALLENNKRVVFTADRPPSHLNEIEARLRSHLSSGLVCALDVADQSLRMGIIERKLDQLAKRLGVAQKPQHDVLQFLADRVPGSIRELEGAVNTLAASAGARLGSLTLDEAMALLQPNLKVSAERRVTVDEIQKLTADHFALKQADLLSERRTRSVARPRQVAMWLCKQHTTRSYPDIGRRFGGRDHTTVLHAVKKVEELLQSDEQIAKDVEALTRKLRG